VPDRSLAGTWARHIAGMTRHRGSYRKATVAAAVGSLSAISLLALLGRGIGSVASIPAQLGLGACAMLAIAATLLLGAITAGGVIALRRDAFEAAGSPYVPCKPRERLPGPTTRMWRALTHAARTDDAHLGNVLNLRPGDWVEVRPLAEIMATLDVAGCLDGLPFMPEMAASCGARARVMRRAEKIHDYVQHTGLRRLKHTVMLEALRCNGSFHGACQASCHILWKESWLRRHRESAATNEVPEPARVPATGGLEPQGSVGVAACAQRLDDDGSTRYVCQMTEAVNATSPLSWADPGAYLRDLTQGNVRIGPFLTGLCIAIFNWAQRARGGTTYPHIHGSAGTTTPHEELELGRGELVRVKGKAAIEATLSGGSRNRGLWFDGEMLKFCGGTYHVAARVERLIDERSGRLIKLRNPCVILDGATASGEYLAFCPQNEAILWREIWLERIAAEPLQPPRSAP
jgi:hypothetical protein